MTFEIFLDILMIALLSVGITYAIILDYRLNNAHEHKREMARLMDQFYKASQKTAEDFMHFKKMQEDMRTTLKAEIDRASVMRDELTFLLNKIQETAPTVTEQNIQPKQPQPKITRSVSEQELINALNALK